MSQLLMGPARNRSSRTFQSAQRATQNRGLQKTIQQHVGGHHHCTVPRIAGTWCSLQKASLADLLPLLQWTSQSSLSKDFCGELRRNASTTFFASVPCLMGHGTRLLWSHQLPRWDAETPEAETTRLDSSHAGSESARDSATSVAEKPTNEFLMGVSIWDIHSTRTGRCASCLSIFANLEKINELCMHRAAGAGAHSVEVRSGTVRSTNI